MVSGGGGWGWSGGGRWRGVVVAALLRPLSLQKIQTYTPYTLETSSST